MRIRIRTEGGVVSRETRAEIQSHLRIMLGTRTAQIESFEVDFGSNHSGEETTCRLTVHALGEVFSVEERAPGRSAATEWAIWRIKHLLDRRALRNEKTRLPGPGHEPPGRPSRD